MCPSVSLLSSRFVVCQSSFCSVCLSDGSIFNWCVRLSVFFLVYLHLSLCQFNVSKCESFRAFWLAGPSVSYFFFRLVYLLFNWSVCRLFFLSVSLLLVGVRPPVCLFVSLNKIDSSICQFSLWLVRPSVGHLFVLSVCYFLQASRQSNFLPSTKNKAGYTAASVTCGWAGAIFEAIRAFEQKQWVQGI